jgi:hypothetical protein
LRRFISSSVSSFSFIFPACSHHASIHDPTARVLQWFQFQLNLTVCSSCTSVRIRTHSLHPPPWPGRSLPWRLNLSSFEELSRVTASGSGDRNTAVTSQVEQKWGRRVRHRALGCSECVWVPYETNEAEGEASVRMRQRGRRVWTGAL